MAESRIATCPRCHRLVKERVNGKLWQHQQWTGGSVQFPPACQGSGKTLVELRAPDGAIP